MTKTIHNLVICVLVSSVAIAQTHGQNLQETQSPDLTESARLNSMVVTLYRDGKYDEAIPLAKKALQLRERARGLNHQELIPLLLNLGELYRSKQRLEEARSYYQRALDIGEKVFGPGDARITRLLDWLAFTVNSLGDNKKAEVLFLRALEIREKESSREDSELAQNLFNLAEIYNLRSDYQKAEPLYQRVIKIRERAGGDDQSDLIRALYSYATVLFATNRSSEGTQLQNRIAELSARAGFIQGGVLNGRAIFLATPDYPVLARRERASGTVQVEVTIDESGKVIAAKAVNPGSTHMTLIHAAENAARKSRFSPTLLSGRPVKVNGLIVFNFLPR